MCFPVFSPKKINFPSNYSASSFRENVNHSYIHCEKLLEILQLYSTSGTRYLELHILCAAHLYIHKHNNNGLKRYNIFILSMYFLKIFFTNFCIFIWFRLFLHYNLHFFLFKINYLHVLLWIRKTFPRTLYICVYHSYFSCF